MKKPEKKAPESFGMIARDLKMYDAHVKKMKVQGAGAPEWARLIVDLRTYYDALDALRKSLSDLKEHLQYTVVPEVFEREGITTFTLKEGYRVTVQPLVRASCRDMEQAIEWMRKHGHEALVKETINASTLSAFAKGELEEGRDLPDDLFNVNVGSNTSITKTK